MEIPETSQTTADHAANVQRAETDPQFLLDLLDYYHAWRNMDQTPERIMEGELADFYDVTCTLSTWATLHGISGAGALIEFFRSIDDVYGHYYGNRTICPDTERVSDIWERADIVLEQIAGLASLKAGKEASSQAEIDEGLTVTDAAKLLIENSLGIITGMATAKSRITRMCNCDKEGKKHNRRSGAYRRVYPDAVLAEALKIRNKANQEDDID